MSRARPCSTLITPALLLLPPLFSSLHAACLAATPSYYYAAGSAHFSTPSSASNSTSAFWLSANGNLTFGFKSLGPSQYLLCIWMTADPQQTPLWWPNLANPILAQDGATLTFTSHGNLQLSDANQSVLWSTSASNASFAKLQNTGNLQLLDGTLKGILWQSFSDLRDTLIVRPRSDDGDNNSTDSLSSIVVDKPYLLQSRLNDTSYAPGRFHVATDEQYSVYLHALDEAHDVDFIYVYAYMNVSGDAFKLTQDYGKTYEDNSSMPMSMLRLDPDGNARIYAWNTTSSTWDRIWQFIDSKCMVGSPCGPYSICKESANGSLNCACPAGYQAADDRSASLGCYNSNLNLSRICNDNGSDGSGYYMAENKQSDYYYNDYKSPQETDDLESCKELCLSDCSCIAATYISGGKCFLKGNTSTWLLMNGYAIEGKTLVMKLLNESTPRLGARVEVEGKGSGVKRGVVIGAVVGAAAIVVTLAAAAATTRWSKIRGLNRHGGMIGVDGRPARFTYQELAEATCNFSELLGEGGFGHVYKGRVTVARAGEAGESRQQLPVAVKVLKSSKTSGLQDSEAEKQFRAEVSTLGKIHHINLVNLLGYCIGARDTDSKRILVYEYIENGSLADFFSDRVKPLLPWRTRYSIALGTARGIAYLHHDCNPPILHCDIKPQNVLLDHDFTPKVADFGLARRFEEVKGHLTMSRLQGTRGYMAPEWLETDEISSKADVYSYGMVLLELVRGFHERGGGGESLVDWAYRSISSTSIREGEPIDIDPDIEESTLSKEYSEDHPHQSHMPHDYCGNVCVPNEGYRESNEQCSEMRERIHVLKIGLWCVQFRPHLRPSMLQVLQLIAGNIGDDVCNIPSFPNPRVTLEDEQSSIIPTSNTNSYISEAISTFFAK